MSLRDLFIKELLEEHDLGVHRLGTVRVRLCALVAKLDGRRELVLERRTGLGPLTLNTRYLHVPADGLADVAAVAQVLIDGREEAPTASSQRLRGLLRLTALPTRLGGLALLGGALLSAAPLPDALASSAPLPSADQVLALAMVTIFAGLALRWITLSLAAQVTGDAPATLLAHHLYGRPSHVRSMGTWRGTLSREGTLLKRSLSVQLQVMATAGGRRALVMTRAHASPFSAGSALWGVPAESAPALLEAIQATRRG